MRELGDGGGQGPSSPGDPVSVPPRFLPDRINVANMCNDTFMEANAREMTALLETPRRGP